MMNKKNNWYVITGGPSVGKSTLLAELEKLGHKTLPEAARVVIDKAIAKGRTVAELRKDEKKFQLDVLEHKIKTELKHPRNLLTFFDRGMHDTISYLRLHGFDIEQKVKEAAQNAQYKKVFLLEPLENYESDYARTESEQEAKKLNELLYEDFKDYGMEPVRVPSLPPKERAEFVLRHID